MRINRFCHDYCLFKNGMRNLLATKFFYSSFALRQIKIFSYVKRLFAKFNRLMDMQEPKCRFNPRNDNFVSFIERIFWRK